MTDDYITAVEVKGALLCIILSLSCRAEASLQLIYQNHQIPLTKNCIFTSQSTGVAGTALINHFASSDSQGKSWAGFGRIWMVWH